jgi:hypothetical protein
LIRVGFTSRVPRAVGADRAALGLALVGDVAVVVVGAAPLTEAGLLARVRIFFATPRSFREGERFVEEVARDELVV